MSRIQPFGNGEEYLYWRLKNCDQCKKDVELIDDEYITHCDIEEAITWGSVTDGKIGMDIYERMGLPDKWDCPEREPIDAL